MLIGHTGEDVKMHYFEGGGCVGRFPLATNENYVNRSTGEQVTNTEWHNVVVRNKAAEVCEKYLKKGDKVFIEGRIKTRKWTDDQGHDRYMTEIQCLEFTFLTPKGNSGMNRTKPESTTTNPVQQPSQSNQAVDSPSNSAEEEDDLPF